MLMDAYRDHGEPADCRVYLRADADGAFSYFFSPEAAKTFERFIKFWDRFGCPDPTNLNQMEVVL